MIGAGDFVMRFELRTGLRGAGKTLGAVEEMLERSKNPDPDRPVYALNFKDLRSDLATVITMEQLLDWKKLPPGSTVYVDEAQRFIPVRTSGEPPSWIRDFSESRHLAIDFVWITQGPTMIDKHVRALIDRHIHTVRKFRSAMVERYEWSEIQERPTSKGAIKCADAKTRHFYSKEAMSCYTSAVMHTVEPSIPPIVRKAVLTLIAIPCLLYGAYWYVKHHSATATAQTTQAADKSTSSTSLMSSGSDQKSGKLMTADEWVHRQIPRVAGIPWSAPIYDDQKPQSTPDLYCVEGEGDHGEFKCLCHTEQGTRATVPVAMCRSFAEGGVYNPYKKPIQQRDAPPPPVESQPAAKPLGGSLLGDTQVRGIESSDSRPRATATAYVPPTMGPWNPEYFGSNSSVH